MIKILSLLIAVLALSFIMTSCKINDRIEVDEIQYVTDTVVENTEQSQNEPDNSVFTEPFSATEPIVTIPPDTFPEETTLPATEPSISTKPTTPPLATTPPTTLPPTTDSVEETTPETKPESVDPPEDNMTPLA